MSSIFDEPMLEDDEEFEVTDSVEMNLDDVDFDEIEDEEKEFPEVISQNTVNVPVSNDIEFDYSGLNNLYGTVVIDVGTKVSALPVEKIRFSATNRTMLAIISNNAVAIKMHYEDGLGSFLCFGGACCDHSTPNVRYLFPVVVYDTDKRGKILSREIDFKVLSLGKDAYDDLIMMRETYGTITNNDLLISCKDEQYQKISFTPQPSCQWKKSSSLTKKISEFWKENMKHIVRAVAKNITPEEYSKMLGELTPEDEIDLNAVFSD